MKRLVLIALLLLAGTAAKAEELAGHVEQIEGLWFWHQLTDIKAPGYRCNGYEGGHGVRITVSDGGPILPFADGCWYKNSSGDIIMIVRTLETGETIVLDRPVAVFTKLSDRFMKVASGAQ
jgi:hypothetical protein